MFKLSFRKLKNSSSVSSPQPNKLQKRQPKTTINKPSPQLNKPLPPPPNQQLKQTHLGARPNSKQKPTLALTEIYDKKHGIQAYNQHHPSAPASSGSKEKFKSNYRVNQIKHHPDRGGAGLDEAVRTENVANIPGKLKNKGYSNQQTEKTVGNFSKARDPVDQLFWATGDSKQPIGGHPGALSKNERDNRHGLTKGHNSKDQTRAKWVDNQFNEGLNKPVPDLKKNTQDTVLMGQVMTNKHLSQPHKQLNAIDVSKSESADVYHPRHGKLVRQNQKTPQFNKAIGAAHNAREARKLQTAYDLKKGGYGNLVPPETHKALAGHKSWEEANNTRYKKQSRGKIDRAPVESQALQGVDAKNPKTLEELSKLNEQEKKNNPDAPKLVRAVSAPRPFIKPQYKNPASGRKVPSQQTKLDGWINR